MLGSSECYSSSRSSRRSVHSRSSNPFSTTRPATSQVAGRTARSTWQRSWSCFSILANVGTAVVLYPIARRQNEALAIGYVGARIIECVFIAAGIIFVLGVVTLRQDPPDAADLAVSLAALKDWTFLFGPGLVVPFGNGLILGYLMYNSGLVPRRMAWLGLIGGPLLLFGNLGVLFDWWEQTGAVSLLVIPEFIWEAFLGIYCAVWGFRRDSPILQPGGATVA